MSLNLQNVCAFFFVSTSIVNCEDSGFVLLLFWKETAAVTWSGGWYE